jgi:hypothetical protein
MAQQNSMKLACQLTFKQNLYVYFIYTVLYHIYLYVFRASIFSRLRMANNKAALYEHLVDMGLKFLPFWNSVSTIQ